MGELAILTVEDGIGRLTLCRPQARNALSLNLLGALGDRLREAASREDLRVLILAGEGKAFCAGMDLKAALQEPGAPAKLLTAIADRTLEIRAFPTPVIARVQGAAIGGGCGLVTVCDLSVTHPEAILGFPEVDLGVCPAVVAPWLVRRAGAGVARRILLEGGALTGAEAHRLGVTTHLARSARTLDDEVDEIAQRISGASPIAVRATKQALNEQEDTATLAAMVRKGAAVSTQVVESTEAQALLRQRFDVS